MKLIPLTRGQFAQVDDADFDWLNQWKWSAHWGRNKFYAARMENRKTLLMHRVILGNLGCLDGEHKDGDGLNNQRWNLRPATRSQNSANRSKTVDNISGFKGVCWDRFAKKWKAQIKRAGKMFHLGRFTSTEEAAKAYDAAALDLFGEFARLNFPQNTANKNTVN